MKKKNEFLAETPTFYKTIGKAVSKSDYQLWFTNRLAREYVAFLSENYNSSNNARERFALHVQAEKLLQIYSMLVYYAYPNRSDFKKKIDTDQELSENFKTIKGWLDQNDGKEYLDYCFRHLSD